MKVTYTLVLHRPLSEELQTTLTQKAVAFTVRSGEGAAHDAVCLKCFRSVTGYLASIEHWQAIHVCTKEG